jgi:hypothetical protein
MITTLALDLEGTLISNAMSQIPRPGLNDFLLRCHELFSRVVVYTAISESRFRPIATLLAQEGGAPAWFAEIEHVPLEENTKDLARIPGAKPHECLLVDDLAEYIHPGQEQQWVPIVPFAAPYPADDQELSKAISVLERRARRLP